MDNSSASGSVGPTVELQHNRLLGALPAADLQRWRPHLEPIHMPAGVSLRRWGQHNGHVYFPATASVSMLYLTLGGNAVEVVAVGHEGMVGLPVIMGAGPTTGDAVVRTGGQGFRVGSAWIHAEFHGCAAVMRLLLRYAHAQMTHIAQSALCNKHHSLEQRLCRCFLSCLDRASGALVNQTHASMAEMLGVRREGVTGVALKLQRAGLIDYARGRVVVIDRCAPETLSCECYRVVKAEYERLFAGSPAATHGSPGMQARPPEVLREAAPPFAPLPNWRSAMGSSA